MSIFPPALISIDRLLSQGVKLAALFYASLSVLFLLFLLFYPLQKKEASALRMRGEQKMGRFLFPHEAIGSGGLSLRQRHAFGWISRLADELVLIAYNSRPDIVPKDVKILMALKNGKDQLTLANGCMVYLKESAQGKGLLFSEEATSLWVKPILFENGAVLVEAGRMLASGEGLTGEEKGQFIIARQGEVSSRYNPTNQPFIKELKLGRAFSCDLLIQRYGGKEYEAWRNKAVIEFARGTLTYACFVSPGDYLLYDEGQWRSCSFAELNIGYPIARVLAISERTAEIEAWDETGFFPFRCNVEMEKQGALQSKSEMTPSAIRLRNGTQISCTFGKRRMILKAGDWLLKTSAGWRILRRTEEVEHYLYHRLKGELFILDGVEKEQGRFVVKGHLFDETRTQMQPLSLPVEADKNQSKVSRKRKPLFSSRGTTS